MQTLKKEYLDNFFHEEYDNPYSAFLSTQKRKTISRQKIQAIFAKSISEICNKSDAQKNLRTLTKTYGGYVHGSSVHIIEMMNKNAQGKLEYQFFGLPHSTATIDMRDHFESFIYNGICSLIIISACVGFGKIQQSASDLKTFFECKTDVLGEETPDQLLKRMKQQPKK